MRFAVWAVVSVAVVTLSGQPAPLSSMDIDQAIQAGKTAKGSIGASCTAKVGFMDMSGSLDGPFDTSALGPLNRISQAARDAERAHRPFTAADVSDQLKAPALLVIATPRKPLLISGTLHRTARAATIEIQSRPPKGEPPLLLAPAAFELQPARWLSPMGLELIGGGIIARFDLAAFMAIPHDEVSVVVHTDSGERSCRLNAADRKLIH